MKQVKLAENLVFLRHKQGVTQEEIAHFLGVTKASVSKWETGQSMPDIMQLPRLASYYDISIDELMGYEAQLSAENIKEYYKKFSAAFVKYSFDEVMAHIHDFLRQYYSCYPAVMQIVVLLLNHYTMAETSKQPDILEEMVKLCEHVQEKCADVNVCNDAVGLHAIIELLRGNPEVTIQKLEPYQNQKSIHNGSEGFLVQAYQMLGQMENALEKNQVFLFNHLLSLVENSELYLMGHLSNREVGMATIERTKQVIEAYELNKLHPNTYLRFQYAMALFYCTQGMEKEALSTLWIFVKEGVDFVQNALYLHGDEYFDRLDNYFKKMDEYVVVPRDKETVLMSISQELNHPAFDKLQQMKEFQEIKAFAQNALCKIKE